MVQFGTGWIPPAHHRIGPQSHNPSFEEKGMRVRLLPVPKLLRFRLLASIAARCRAWFDARFRRVLAKMRSSRRHSHMSTEEIEDVVQAMTTVVENLEASAARQSMQEAFMQVRVYADAMRASSGNNPAVQKRTV